MNEHVPNLTRHSFSADGLQTFYKYLHFKKGVIIYTLFWFDNVLWF